VWQPANPDTDQTGSGIAQFELPVVSDVSQHNLARIGFQLLISEFFPHISPHIIGTNFKNASNVQMAALPS